MGPKKKVAKAAAGSAKTPVAAGAAGGTEVVPAVAFTPAEAKKLAKLLKTSDRGKRLEAIRVVSENHGYVATGGCLLPLLESVVVKKKTEEVVRAASQVLVEYLVGREAEADPTLPSDAALAALQEAKKKPAKYKLAEVLANLVLNPEQVNSWNAVRSLRSIAATVASLPSDSPKTASLSAMLLGPGQPVERLCTFLVVQEALRGNSGEDAETSGGDTRGGSPGPPWPEVRLHVMDTIGVICGVNNDAIQTVISTGTVRCVLGVLRAIMESDTPDLSLLTSTLVILFAVAKAGGWGIPLPAGGDGASGLSPDGVAPAGRSKNGGGIGGGAMPPELEALAEGGAWGTVYDALKGPCMARATELQQANATGGGGGKKGTGDAAAVSADLTACLDNMARCAEILRVMAMTGAGLEEEGALEAGVAAMSSILGMKGLPREQAPVANLMTGMVKAMGSIACLSEDNRVKVCNAGAAAKVLSLMAPLDPTAAAGETSPPPDTPHGRLMRKTAEKCLHHLVVSRVTWMADDRALCDTSAPAPGEPDSSGDAIAAASNEGAAGGGGSSSRDRDARAERRGRAISNSSSGGSGGRAAGPDPPPPPPPSLGPAYLAVDAVLAAADADSIDVRCRAIRLLSRLMSSPRCAAALGVFAVPALGRLVGWWLRTKDDPEAHRTPRPLDPASAEGGGGKSTGGGAGKKAAAAPGGGGKGAAKEAAAAAAAAAAAEAAKEEQAAEDEAAAAAAAAAARTAARKLEESDSTRVLRDEALAYALTVMLNLAETGRDERAAVGEDTIVQLLSGVLRRLPCTPEEFFANSGERRRSSTAASGTGAGFSAGTTKTTTAAAGDASDPAGAGKTGAARLPKDSGGGTPHAPSHAAGRLLDPKPDTTLDLSLAQRSPSSSTNPRKLCCWRGEKSRDAEVPLFSPLDWGWNFEVGVSQEPVQPGLVLRAAVLRVLLAVADGYNPAAEAGSAAEAAGAASTAAKGGAGAAAAAEASAKAAALIGGNGARAVLNHVLPVCLDLLSVDVRYGKSDDDDVGSVVEGFGGAGSSGRSNTRSVATSASPQDSRAPAGAAEGNPAANNNLTAEILMGRPVSPSEELVHEEIRVACLRLLRSLLRLGQEAREALLSAAATHRDGGFSHLEEDSCGNSLSTLDDAATPSPNLSGSASDKTAAAVTKKSAGGGEAGTTPWVRPDSFRSWNLREGGDLSSVREALPYVRALSLFMLPLRNPDAPVIDIVAAQAALDLLCREGEHEAGGAKPEPRRRPAGDGGGDTPLLPSSREGTAGVLVDVLAGVAVSMGALVPLVSIWGCALAAAGSAAKLAPDVTGMVSECQGLIEYLIGRGHVRETFWSSLPSPGQVVHAKAAAAAAPAAAAAAPKKAQRKSKGSAGKGGKGGGGKLSKEGSSSEALEMEDEEVPDVPKAAEQPAGRPDPNLGPDRASWGELLNTRVDEQRTQTYGTTALLMATETGLETAVAGLLLAGADPNVSGSDGRSPLMCALAQGMDEAARSLVEAGADVDAVNLQGDSVLKCAFLCPFRQAMRNIMRKRPESGGRDVTAVVPSSSARSASSGRRSSRTPIDGGSTNGRAGRRVSSSRSESRSRSRSRSGSLTRDRRRSSLSRSVSFGEAAFRADPAAAAEAGPTRRRLSSRTALSSARTALRDSSRRESARPLKTPRGTTVVGGDARMVPFILGCGADPNVSSGTGDFPLHWAVTGTELTVRIMNQKVKIVAGGGVVGGGEGIGSARTESTDGKADERTVTATEEGQGDLPLLKILVEAGSDLDACNPEGMTALHAAVIAGRGALAGALLDAGASPNFSDSLGCLPLHYACLRAITGYAELASRMLALGMGRPLDKGIHRDFRKGKTRREKHLLDVAETMRRGLREATQPSCITQHRATRSELLNFVSAEGFTPLHFVCDGRVAGRHAAASVLALWQERASVAGVPPGGTAVPGERSSGASSHGTRNAPAGSGGGGGGGGVGIKADKKGLPMPMDGSTDRVEILTWLLSEPEVDPKVRVPRGATTLHMAAALPGSEAGPDLVRSLLHNGGANLDALDSPASSGSGDRFWKTASTTRGSSPHQAGGDGGQEEEKPPLRFSALHYALQAGSWESASLLLAAGASVAPEGAFPPCLHVACLAAVPASLVERLLEGYGRLSGAAVLSDLGGGPGGATPLFLAAVAGSADIIGLLLSARGRMNALNNLEDSIAENDETETATTMVGAAGRGDCCGDDLEAMWTMEHSPSDGRSPLHAAAAAGHKAAARVLLDAELRAATAAAGKSHDESLSSRSSWLNTPDKWGDTPPDLAVSEGHWECAEILAAAARFDIRLAVGRGPSSVLIAAERANMAIVDEGLGDASTLSALRESNRLVMTLLGRLHDATAAAALPAEGEEDSIPSRGDDLAHQAAAGDQATTEPENAPPPAEEDETANQLEGEEARPQCAAASSSSALASDAPAPRSTHAPPPAPVVHHLHPCFAEGVLYSNAKGIFVPDTPERRRQRRESRQHDSGLAVINDEDHAAVIIQSRARQAGARKAVAEKRNKLDRERGQRSSSSIGGVRRRERSDATDQERAAVLIQSQARQARAKAETARIRDQRKQPQQRRRSSKQWGEVGVVVVKAGM